MEVQPEWFLLDQQDTCPDCCCSIKIFLIQTSTKTFWSSLPVLGVGSQELCPELAAWVLLASG